MFKSLIAALVLAVMMVGFASATSYSLMGGIVISGTGDSAMANGHVINIDYDRVYITESACLAAKTKMEKADVRRATSSSTSDYGKFAGVKFESVPMMKTVILECVSVN